MWKPVQICQFFLCLIFLTHIGNIHAADQANVGWRDQWENTIKEAEKEGLLNLYSNAGHEFIRDFQKNFPKIKIVLVTGRRDDLVTRIMSERRAGKYLADVAKLGTGSSSLLYRARPFPLQPLNSIFILPEVVDKSKWWQGTHHYVDPEGKYIFAPFVSVYVQLASYNTKLVNPFDLTSYWDLLNPKWKGKILALDPRAAGGRQGGRLLYYHPDLGPQFLKRLLTDMDIVLIQDYRQAVDWLAQGKYALLLFTSPSEVTIAKEKGLPVNILDPRGLKETPVVDNASSTLVLMDKAPHSNAAKVFINWVLSREGQISAQKTDKRYDSTRIDIPKEDVSAIYRRQQGVQYFRLWDLEWMEIDTVRNLISETLKQGGKN